MHDFQVSMIRPAHHWLCSGRQNFSWNTVHQRYQYQAQITDRLYCFLHATLMYRQKLDELIYFCKDILHFAYIFQRRPILRLFLLTFERCLSKTFFSRGIDCIGPLRLVTANTLLNDQLLSLGPHSTCPAVFKGHPSVFIYRPALPVTWTGTYWKRRLSSTFPSGYSPLFQDAALKKTSTWWPFGE